MAWLVTQRGFVNTWECDENEHLNVQFYFARFADAAAHFLVGRGLAPFGPERRRGCFAGTSGSCASSAPRI